MHADIATLLREDDIRHDPWGTALAHHFAVAEILTTMGEAVPSSWQYRQGLCTFAGLADLAEEQPHSEYVYLLNAGTITAEDLRHTGNVLRRYIIMCEHYGKDY